MYHFFSFFVCFSSFFYFASLLFCLLSLFRHMHFFSFFTHLWCTLFFSLSKKSIMAKETIHFQHFSCNSQNITQLTLKGKIEHESLITSNQTTVSIKCYCPQLHLINYENSIALAKRVRHMCVAKDNNIAPHKSTR